jgi:hypothetical protein
VNAGRSRSNDVLKQLLYNNCLWIEIHRRGYGPCAGGSRSRAIKLALDRDLPALVDLNLQTKQK